MATVTQVMQVIEGAADTGEAAQRLRDAGQSVTALSEMGFTVGALVDVMYTPGTMRASPRWTAWSKTDPVKTRQTVTARRMTDGTVAEGTT